MIQKILLIVAVMTYMFVGVESVKALDPIQIAPKIEKVIIIPSNTPTPIPIKLIKPSIKFELVSTPKATATVTPKIVVVTATPTPAETGTVTVTPEVTKAPSPTETTATVTTIPKTEEETPKPTAKESIPWYIMVTIGALIGIIVVQAWPKKLDKEE